MGHGRWLDAEPSVWSATLLKIATYKWAAMVTKPKLEPFVIPRRPSPGLAFPLIAMEITPGRVVTNRRICEFDHVATRMLVVGAKVPNLRMSANQGERLSCQEGLLPTTIKPLHMTTVGPRPIAVKVQED